MNDMWIVAIGMFIVLVAVVIGTNRLVIWLQSLTEPKVEPKELAIDFETDYQFAGSGDKTEQAIHEFLEVERKKDV